MSHIFAALRRGLLLGVVFLTSIATADATVVRYDWTAVIDDNRRTSFGLSNGSVVSGTFFVDGLSGVPDNFMPESGTDYQVIGLQSVDLPDTSPFPDFSAPPRPSTSGGGATVADNRTASAGDIPIFDQLKIGSSFFVADSPGVSNVFFSIFGTPDIFSDQSLPLFLDLAAFESARMQINFRGLGRVGRTGALTSITATEISAVPLPGTLPLSLPALAIGLLLRRRRQ